MRMDANTLIKDWPKDSRMVTAALITKYGPADEATPTLVTWHNRGPWKKIMASKVATPHSFPFPYGDIVENFTDYKVPLDAYPQALVTALREGPPGPVMYTGGLENYPNLIAQIDELE